MRICLLTLRKQEYEPIEVIIVDGNSTDETRLVVLENKDLVSLFICERDSGQAEAVTKGLGRATGEIIHWHAADDVFMPGALNRINQEFSRDPRVDLIFSDGWAFTERELCANWASRFTTFWDSLLFFGRFQSDCAYWRASATAQGLPLSDAMPLTCDEDFFLRIWANKRARWINHKLGAFRVREGQLSKTLNRSSLHRDRVESRIRVIRLLGLTKAHVRFKRVVSFPTYLLRGWAAPRAERAFRYLWRKLTFDRHRKAYARWFFTTWIQ